jgi:transcriptional regulator
MKKGSASTLQGVEPFVLTPYVRGSILPFDARKERRLAEKSRGDVLQGTLDMLVLKALQLGPMHGWGITERLDTGSERVLQVGQGSLYPALYRLERQGYIASEWGVTENNRQARYYKLTAAGRRRLAEERMEWARLSRAVDLVLRMGEG